MVDEHRVRPQGDIDVTTAPPLLEGWLTEIDEHRPRLLVIDLADVTRLDAQGLGLIATLHGRQARDGHQVILTNVSPVLRRALRGTRLGNLVRVVDAGRLR